MLFNSYKMVHCIISVATLQAQAQKNFGKHEIPFQSLNSASVTGFLEKYCPLIASTLWDFL